MVKVELQVTLCSTSKFVIDKSSNISKNLCGTPALGNYTSRQGVCWPNQITIAKNTYKSTTSRHIKKLIEWDYIRYAKKHPGLKGNKYFMVFDPKIKEEDALAMVPDKDRSYEDKPEIHVGPKGGGKKNYAPRVHKTKDKNGSNMVPYTYQICLNTCITQLTIIYTL